ncbi:hypothetical protein CcaCcLH18_12364 [Colletotrichum camelliae]|nr:hypothetical protein CcaCcLH18_12364 [Colletotrichum camelliae]
MWDFSQAAIVSAWLEDVYAASDQETRPRSPEPSTSRKRKAPSPDRTQSDRGDSHCDQGRTQMENRRSRRISSGGQQATKPSTPPDGSGRSLDATDSGAESPTPRRPVKTVKAARRPKKTTDTADGQGSTSRELPSRSLSFPQATPSMSSSASASAYTGAISHRPHHTATTMTSAPSLPPSESGSRRSRSPVKGMASMSWAQRPVKIVPLKRGQVPDDIQALCEEVHRIMMGVAVVPASVRKHVESSMSALRPFGIPLEDKNLDDSCQRDDFNLLGELRDLGRVVKNTERAIVQNLAEAHWNDSVHSQLLSIAIEGDREEEEDDDAEGECVVTVYNTTQAVISPMCIPQHVSDGVQLEARIVDYCMCINDPAIERAARNAIKLHKQSLDTTASSSSAASSSAASDASDVFSSPRKGTKPKKTPAIPESVNHTPYSALAMSPITVSIETKKNDGSEDVAKAQLSVWASAQILRLRQLIGSDDPLGITLPLVFVLGSSWQLLFAVEKEDRIDLIQSLSFRFDGASNTILGCYKILALVRALRTWSKTVFRDWFLNALPAT